MESSERKPPSSQFVVCVTIRVVPGQADAFIAATRANAEGTRREPKNIRFDLLRAIDEPTRFFLYEAYTEEEGFREHQRTEHYLAWRGKVEGMMGEPRVAVKHVAVFPELSFPRSP